MRIGQLVKLASGSPLLKVVAIIDKPVAVDLSVNGQPATHGIFDVEHLKVEWVSDRKRQTATLPRYMFRNPATGGAV